MASTFLINQFDRYCPENNNGQYIVATFSSGLLAQEFVDKYDPKDENGKRNASDGLRVIEIELDPVSHYFELTRVKELVEDILDTVFLNQTTVPGKEELWSDVGETEIEITHISSCYEGLSFEAREELAKKTLNLEANAELVNFRIFYKIFTATEYAIESEKLNERFLQAFREDEGEE